MIWMLVSLWNSHVEILVPNVLVLGGEDFGVRLGHEDQALMNKINVFIKETKRAPSFFPPCKTLG